MRPTLLTRSLSSSIGFLFGLLFSIPAAESPWINSVLREGPRVRVSATVPAGFRHVVLESQETLPHVSGEPLIAGGLGGEPSVVTFNVPLDRHRRFLTLRAGTDPIVPSSTFSGPAYFAVTVLNGSPLSTDQKRLHVLNRAAYGPSPADVAWVESVGAGPYLELQLRPDTIDETQNLLLQQGEAALFTSEPPREDHLLVQVGEPWRYFRGTQAPPADWKQPAFPDTGWLEGPSGFGYGDDDDATELEDMRESETQPGYLTVFLRKSFAVVDPTAIEQLILRVDFDDGFVAYLNGVEVARENVAGTPPGFSAAALENHEAGLPVEYDLTPMKSLLQAGINVLAVQGHNFDRASSDFSLIPALLSRRMLPGDPVVRIRGIEELQQLVHVRGAYARRQLQAVLAEFWENHFTTDAEKVADYFDELENSDGSDAMSGNQAEREAAQAEYEEYQFFHDQALGQFGDLLLYSATSPAMLIYLDSVQNRKGAPNENYAREILELFAFGVDNRYTQIDIEQLARCFTGWTVRKVQPAIRPDFPESARQPLTSASVAFAEDVLLEVGPGWRYFKGTREPSPGAGGARATGWTTTGFDDSQWTPGATSVGYGDNDDATVLTDMRGNYASVYLRRPFTVAAGENLDGLLLSVRYDDGFVAYLNGTEIGRSETMRQTGNPPRFNTLASGGREADADADLISLQPFLGLLRPAPETNVLAIQVHNVELNSSDLSIHPRLIQRRVLPGSIENGDPNGLWVFRFDPGQHDTGAKRLFVGTPYELAIPAGRTGVDGVRDAVEVIDAMVRHPSTREFICLKLINKLVSDDLNLVSYRNGTAPEGLRTLMDEALAAWMSTTPPGNLETVVRAILKPSTQDGYFWSASAYRGKIKTPIEFINSSLRALQGSAGSARLPEANDTLGMHLFTRDDPDGWSEIGFDWMDTGSLLERIKFIQRLAGNLNADLAWDVTAFTEALADKSAGGIVDHFNALLYGGLISPAQRELLIRFATTDDQGQALPLEPARADYRRRVQELVSLVLAMPQWHNQ